MAGDKNNLSVSRRDPAIIPDAIAVPLRHNTLVYGPWSAQEKPGKVKAEHKQDLNPWNYGGAANMSSAGFAYLSEAVKGQQEAEKGTIELAGCPDKQLGEELITGGPNITGINVSVSNQGVKADYTLQTYSPIFGLFGGAPAETLRNTGIAIANHRADLRQSFERHFPPNTTLQQAKDGRFVAGKVKMPHKRKKPDQVPNDTHTGMVLFQGGARKAGPGVKPEVNNTNVPQLMNGQMLSDEGAQNKEKRSARAVMDHSGLMRPMSTDPDHESGLPHFGKPIVTGKR